MAMIEGKAGTIPEILKRRAEENPEKEAYIFVDRFGGRIILSRKYVWDQSRRFAAILKAHGIDKGDIVCNTLINSPARLITTYGTITAGAITMNWQQILANDEDIMLWILKHSRCRSIIADTGKKNEVLAILDEISNKDESTGQIYYKELPHLASVIKIKVYSEEGEEPSSKWLSNLENKKDMFVHDDIKEENVAVIFTTSGTTGLSKLVPQTHRNLILDATELCSAWNLTEKSVLYSNRYLGWVSGFPKYYLSTGCKNIISNHAYGLPEDSALHMLRVFKEEKCSHGNISAIDVGHILELIQSDKSLSYVLDFIGLAGMPLTRAITKAIDVLTRNVLVFYAGTEFGTVSTCLVGNQTSFEDYCSGRLLDVVEMKIVDESSQQVTRGKSGEIILRSPFIADGYLNDPEKTKNSFSEDGWFRTGDLGYEDKSGQLFVLGRMKNAIMKGNFIIYPGWLEAQILKCPGIQA